MRKRSLITLSSKKAWKEGFWHENAWYVIDREGDIRAGGFQTRREACEWRDKAEKVEQ